MKINSTELDGAPFEFLLLSTEEDLNTDCRTLKLLESKIMSKRRFILFLLCVTAVKFRN